MRPLSRVPGWAYLARVAKYDSWRLVLVHTKASKEARRADADRRSVIVTQVISDGEAKRLRDGPYLPQSVRYDPVGSTGEVRPRLPEGLRQVGNQDDELQVAKAKQIRYGKPGPRRVFSFRIR